MTALTPLQQAGIALRTSHGKPLVDDLVQPVLSLLGPLHAGPTVAYASSSLLLTSRTLRRAYAHTRYVLPRETFLSTYPTPLLPVPSRLLRLNEIRLRTSQNQFYTNLSETNGWLHAVSILPSDFTTRDPAHCRSPRPIPLRSSCQIADLPADHPRERSAFTLCHGERTARWSTPVRKPPLASLLQQLISRRQVSHAARTFSGGVPRQTTPPRLRCATRAERAPTGVETAPW